MGRPSRVRAGWGVAWLLVAGCGNEEQSCLGDEAVAVDSGAPAECFAEVVVGLYSSDQCRAGEEVLEIRFDVAQPCDGWPRDAGTSTRYNSASRFECWSDRLCYTQFTGSCSCESEDADLVTDKESRTDCRKDDTPDIWTRVLSGTESCPEPPEGYACPLSEPGEGTGNLAAACE